MKYTCKNCGTNGEQTNIVDITNCVNCESYDFDFEKIKVFDIEKRYEKISF